jgi:hypothetical protein
MHLDPARLFDDENAGTLAFHKCTPRMKLQDFPFATRVLVGCGASISKF